MSNQTNTNTTDKELQLDVNKTKDVNGKSLSEVLGMAGLNTLMGSGAPKATMEETIMIKANADWTLSLSEALIDAVYMYDGHIDDDKLTPELLSVYLQWVILNRVNYLENGRNEVHPRSMSYPTVMYDALARLTRYDGSTTDGANIIPSVGDAKLTQDQIDTINKWCSAAMIAKDGKSRAKSDKEVMKVTFDSWLNGGKVRVFPGHDKLEAMLKVAGIEMATGLPMTRKSSIRTMFEMDIDVDDYITTAGKVPQIQDVFARSFYHFQALSSLVGMQKVELLLYSVLREKLLDVAKSYVKNYRG